MIFYFHSFLITCTIYLQECPHHPHIKGTHRHGFWLTLKKNHHFGKTTGTSVSLISLTFLNRSVVNYLLGFLFKTTFKQLNGFERMG